MGPHPPDRKAARDAGAGAIASLRRGLNAKLAEIIRRDPERAANAVEVGLIDRRWLEDPAQHPVSTATPTEVLERFLQKSVEERPSTLNQLGLNTLQLLTVDGDRERAGGATEEITVVFTDLEGFTRYTSDEGDTAAIELLTELQRGVGPVVRSRGGRVVKRLGDGLMLSFPEPEAAVFAAVELLDVAPSPLRLRAGLHRGEAVVSSADVVGHMVNVAARVTEQAKGGEVLSTVEVRDAVGELRGVKWSKPRRIKAKGIPERIEVVAVTAA